MIRSHTRSADLSLSPRWLKTWAAKKRASYSPGKDFSSRSQVVRAMGTNPASTCSGYTDVEADPRDVA